MKKIINTSIIYLILGLIGGVFYREFTKFNSFEGRTSLAFVHTHLIMLGTILFLLLALICKISPSILKDKYFKSLYIIHNIGLPLMTAALIIRGIIQVKNIGVSTALNHTIMSLSGASHIMLAISLIGIMLIIKKHLIKNC